jgi:hypothetical protein
MNDVLGDATPPEAAAMLLLGRPRTTRQENACHKVTKMKIDEQIQTGNPVTMK